MSFMLVTLTLSIVSELKTSIGTGESLTVRGLPLTPVTTCSSIADSSAETAMGVKDGTIVMDAIKNNRPDFLLILPATALSMAMRFLIFTFRSLLDRALTRQIFTLPSNRFAKFTPKNVAFNNFLIFFFFNGLHGLHWWTI